MNSQNLIENPSFEAYHHCPDHLGSFSEDVIAWSTPTNGSTDYFHKCSMAMGIPHNFKGSQAVKEGSAYIGFYTYAPNDYREYIQGKLRKKLEKDRVYELTFYVSLAENSEVSVYDFGVLFAEDQLQLPIKKVISRYQLSKLKDNAFTYLTINNKEGYQDTSNWILISVNITGQGFENYLCIGNFNSNAATRKSKRIKNSNLKGAYYYIDRVSLMEKGAAYNVNETYVFENVLFDFDDFSLDEVSKKEIEKVYAYLLKNDTFGIHITGHTDTIGYDTYNLKLSHKRAQAVADYLISLGLSENRVHVNAYGSEKPLVENANEIEQHRNRRVEFAITMQ